MYEGWHAFSAGISSILIAGGSLVRGLPQFISARPRTPLRVLCLVAFDTLHKHRNAKPMPLHKVQTLAVLLDFGANANAALDNKPCCPDESLETRQILKEAGMDSFVTEYLQRLKQLEHGRPLPGGDYSRFYEIRLYREAVTRLSLGMVAATVNGNQCLDEAIRATANDADLNLLWRIVMQCQLIDDVLDYSTDISGGLPSFLTATTSLAQGFELARLAAVDYADVRNVPRTGDIFPLRTALFLVSMCAKLVMCWGRWQARTRLERRFAEYVNGGQPPTCEGVDWSLYAADRYCDEFAGATNGAACVRPE